MNRITLVFLGCCIVSPLAFGQSSGDSAAGKKLAEAWQCTLCHGPDGNGNKGIANVQMADVPRIPRISAQPQAYFIKSMRDYKSGERSDDNMQVLAKQLSDKDIRDLAAWYGSQKPSAVATYYNDPRN
jgi:cytochrome c553